MKRSQLLSLLTILTFLFATGIARCEEFKDFAELDLEELLNTKVVNASIISQKLQTGP